MRSWFGARREPSTTADLEADARARLSRRDWPEPLLAALARLREGGHQAWLVGGAVRDALLGRAPSRRGTRRDRSAPRGGARAFARVEPIGLAHGTVLVLEPGVALEVTTFRREAYADARHPDSVEFTDDARADLARRDLTVNALAFDPASGVLLDPHGGLSDRAGRLRAGRRSGGALRRGRAASARVARFAATLEMAPEPATRAALAIPLERASRVAWERVRDELVRTMAARTPSTAWWLLREAGLLARWLPELDACFAVPQNRHHAYDVFVHSLETCDAAPADKPRVRWAALLHDVGKPGTAVLRKGDWTFYGHEKLGAELADRALERLRFPTAEREAVVHLVREHMFDYRAHWSEAAIRRWLRRVGVESVADLFDLRIADAQGNGLRHGWPGALDEFRDRIERELARASALTVRDLALGGADVMRVLGVPAGREVGEALDAMLERVLEHPELNTPEALERELCAWGRERRRDA